MRERFLPEFPARGRDRRKLQYAVLAAAALHGGVEPEAAAALREAVRGCEPAKGQPSRTRRHAPAAPAFEPARAARCGRARHCHLRPAAPLRSTSQWPPLASAPPSRTAIGSGGSTDA